jgi:hypothetical protein
MPGCDCLENLSTEKLFWVEVNLMPVCPECSFWTPNFGEGEVDHNGTYVMSFWAMFKFLDGSVIAVGKHGKSRGERNVSILASFCPKIVKSPMRKSR